MPSGLDGEHKVPRVLLRLGAKQCLSLPPLDDLKKLSLSECGKEIARCLEEVRETEIIIYHLHFTCCICSV